MTRRASTRDAATDANLRVVVVGDARLGARLALLLEAAGHVVRTRKRTTDVAESLNGYMPDVLVLAAGIRDEHAALVSEISESCADHPSCRLVTVVSTATIREMRALFTAGTDALVLDSEAEALLPAAVSAVAAGLLVFPRSLRKLMVRPALSAREKQVLGLVVLGLTNREIADRLRVSESTVKSHLATAFRKLGAKSRREAASLILDPSTGLGTGILAIAEDA